MSNFVAIKYDPRTAWMLQNRIESLSKLTVIMLLVIHSAFRDLKRTMDIDYKAKSLWWKTMLHVWWDQKDGIYYELLKPDETVNMES
ncbi:hypothetical protein CDAR_579361 [Caerostris darwini]|uniref:Uncharacterized protein n=1 Tax=Caerostris darwini TaxID=1538125 RepID=A0AAV4V2Z7_9ARAC|nr:hypothetical protein CDAR_579361 [Caerostris darwini]